MLAASSNTRIQGIESIRKDQWDGDAPRSGGLIVGDILDIDDLYGGPRPADEIEAKYIEVDVTLKITWNIA